MLAYGNKSWNWWEKWLH